MLAAASTALRAPAPRGAAAPRRGGAAVRAAAAAINPSIRKDEAKVVDTVVASEMDKPMVAYCRCWKSGTFPLCNGAHMAHNKEAGDNVGPLLVKKE